MGQKAKLRWKIVEIWGDYYWCDTKVEDNLGYCFSRMPVDCKDERDMERLVNEQINSPMPLNRP